MEIFTVTWNDADGELWHETQLQVEPFAAASTIEGAFTHVATAIRSDLAIFEEDEELAAEQPNLRVYARTLCERQDLDLIRAVAAGDWDPDNSGDRTRVFLTDDERWPLEGGCYCITRLEVRGA